MHSNYQPQTTAPQSNLLTKAEAATYLGIRPRTLDDWRTAKVIPFIERARYIRFRRSDLDAFLEANTVQPRQSTPYRPRKSRGVESSQ